MKRDLSSGNVCSNYLIRIVQAHSGSGETILLWKDLWNGRIGHLEYP
jgi:hypothetical protein